MLALLVSSVTRVQADRAADAAKALELAVDSLRSIIEKCARPRVVGIVLVNGNDAGTMKLVNPQYFMVSGQCNDPPDTEITGVKASDPIVFCKTNDSARGTVGLLSYQIESKEHKLVILWSAPHDQNFYENWWNVAMVERGKALDQTLFDDLYKSAKKGSQSVHLAAADGSTYDVIGSMGKEGKTSLQLSITRANKSTSLPGVVRIKNLHTNKWLTHEGGIKNQNWISSTGNKNDATVWDVVGDSLDKTYFKARGTNLYLSYRESTGACKFVDSQTDADFKMEYLPVESAWTAMNNRWQKQLWMYGDPYPYVRGGVDNPNKARWVMENAK